MTLTRRRILLGTGGLAAGLAGCLDDRGQGGAETWATASFFTLSEFTRAVTGDLHTVENAVPSGEHGHEWEPPIDMLPRVVESDVFVYIGTEGFQPWVDDALDQIETYYADDVSLVDAAKGIELLEYDGDGHGHDHDHGHTHDHDHGHTHDHDHGDAEPSLEVRNIELIDRSAGQPVVDAHADHWHGEPLVIPTEGTLSIGAAAETDDGPVEIGPPGYALEARIVDGPDGLEIDAHGDHLHVSGDEAGDGAVIVQLVDDDAVVWEAPPLEVVVGDGDEEAGSDDGHGHGDDHEHEDDGHGHSHGEYDAKFFSDPILAQEGVRNIRDDLIAIDPDNAAAYEENAAAYVEELEALHEEFASALEDREHDHVVLAGHDSFQYLAERYGLEIHTPVGLSPDDTPSGRDVAATVDFVEEHGLEYVLWDYFDGPDVAEQIAAEADTVTDTIMVSPAESVVEEWVEAGHGDFIGQLREITLPAFETALGAR
ncbi:metal ABC transporter solute-binding protein, Zn/Mn family [Natrarchaeobaculum aegyptiacum]|uniref:ABC transporter substrate-binding protein n=1 Tax=Natrarchaeobaculum aegyptiacum TaxID=745377 RepID=A0A2Z2HP63_9EURY|nr:zinc ABC transporter substrate-binding protein [Natrarchaeobaculum aegyptiacum]ARS88789.1 hypothetical protein B1756_02790 [Natrarchaeobaculum aegyptiacum]